MRVLKQRAISDLLHEIKQFGKIRTSFLLQSELQKTYDNTNLKKLAKNTEGFVTFNFTYF